MEITNFKLFESTGAKLSTNAISISSNFGFGFLSGFHHRNNIKDYDYVSLLYSAEDDAIGFIFSRDKIKGSFKMTHSDRNTSSGVVCRSFFTGNKIDDRINEIVGHYEPKETNHPQFGKMFYIDLKEKQNKN